ncbi:MAG: pseudouridine synthase [Myxococcota bacterium]
MDNQPKETASGESPAHALFNPPVCRADLRPSVRLGFGDFVDWAASETGWEREQLERCIFHGGVWVGRFRWANRGDIDAGELVRLYRFEYEPASLELADDVILHEDERWLVVNKPSWIPVQGTRASMRLSLEHMLKTRCGTDWLSPVHRLDRQTSGVNVFAKSALAFEHAAAQFRRQRVKKRYLAKLADSAEMPSGCEWSVRLFQTRRAHSSHSAFCAVDSAHPNAREGVTEFRIRDRAHALVEAMPRTGRTHQIRLHLAETVGPIAGDTLYGEPWRPGAPQRVLLHAERLQLQSATGENSVFLAPAPDELTLSVGVNT